MDGSSLDIHDWKSTIFVSSPAPDSTEKKWLKDIDMHHSEEGWQSLEKESTTSPTISAPIWSYIRRLFSCSSSDDFNEFLAYRVTCMIMSLIIFALSIPFIMPLLKGDPEFTAPFEGRYGVLLCLVVWKAVLPFALSASTQDVFDAALIEGISLTPVEISIYLGFRPRTIIILSALSIVAMCVPTIAPASRLAPTLFKQSRGFVATRLLLKNARREKLLISPV
ncbi:hypothetical protein KEM54_004630 [Ascosphaera aggregata]|nr:hypothetical protein KEM54_004630 [Ascosphaera aggregata]